MGADGCARRDRRGVVSRSVRLPTVRSAGRPLAERASAPPAGVPAFAGLLVAPVDRVRAEPAAGALGPVPVVRAVGAARAATPGRRPGPPLPLPLALAPCAGAAGATALAPSTAGRVPATGGRRPTPLRRWASLPAAAASFVCHVGADPIVSRGLPSVPTACGSRARRRPRRMRSLARRGRPRNPGDDLLSQGVPPQVPSALAVFTSVFGMGTGVSPPQLSPETLVPRGHGFSCQSPHESSRASTSVGTQREERTQALGRLVPVG